MKTLHSLILGILIGLSLAAGIILLLGLPRGEPIPLPQNPTSAPLVVSVTGQVQQPGLVSLPAGSRWSDALAAAGGVLPQADLSALNLARLLEDGEALYVPAEGEEPAAQPSSAGNLQPPSGPIDLNTASAEQLDTLPGIGPGKAADIVSDREENGPFASVEDLLRVSGIGPGTLEDLQGLVTVSP